jgi:hypothetical protein
MILLSRILSPCLPFHATMDTDSHLHKFPIASPPGFLQSRRVHHSP